MASMSSTRAELRREFHQGESLGKSACYTSWHSTVSLDCHSRSESGCCRQASWSGGAAMAEALAEGRRNQRVHAQYVSTASPVYLARSASVGSISVARRAGIHAAGASIAAANNPASAVEWQTVAGYGPVEWLWHSATYEKWQPMRIAHIPLIPRVAGANEGRFGHALPSRATKNKAQQSARRMRQILSAARRSSVRYIVAVRPVRQAHVLLTRLHPGGAKFR